MALEIKFFKATAVGDSRSQHDEFPTVEAGKEVSFTWETTGAKTVELTGMADGETIDTCEDLPGSGEIKRPVPREATYRLEATAPDGTTQARVVRVHIASQHQASPVAMLKSQKIDLPLLLCGPMLRRVKVESESEKTFSLSVFFIARKPVTARVILQAVSDSGAPTTRDSGIWLDAGPGIQDPVATVPLGPSAHACVFTGTYTLEFGSFYKYDLELTTLDGVQQGLLDSGVVTANQPLDDELNRYGGLPAFLTPPVRLEDLRIAYGSCRKANGQSVDALAMMDALLHDSDRYPHQLLLIGDQIYADEVAPSFLDFIRHHARALFSADQTGFTETLPGHAPPGKPRMKIDPFAFNDLGTGKLRGKILYKTPGWAAHKTDHCHLLFLHEFFLAYLLMFSPALWGDFEAGPWDGPGGVMFTHEYPLYRAQLGQFKASLPKVRRVLASIPTLMIGDDHEVTDDWNLDSQFLVDLRACNLQARLVRNALCAYAVFQDWGNRPELYKKGGLARPILDALALGGTGPAWTPPPWLNDSTADAGHLNRLLLPLGATGAATGSESPPPGTGATGPVHNARSASGGELSFDYILQYPTHRLVVLDTRTRRHFPAPKKGTIYLAQLIGKDSLEAQIPETSQPGRLDLIVSATPIYSEPTVEHLFTLIRARLSARRTDQESWSVSPEAVDHISRRLMLNPRTVVLSGDVHYSFAIAMDLVVDKDAHQTRSRVVQLCSSSLRREDFTARLAGLGNFWHGPNADPPIKPGTLDALPSWPPWEWPDAVDKANTPPRPETQPGDKPASDLNFHRTQLGVDQQGLADDLKTPAQLDAQLSSKIGYGIGRYVVPNNNFAWISFTDAAGRTRVQHHVVWVIPKKKVEILPTGRIVRDDDEGHTLPHEDDLGCDYALMLHDFEVNPA